MNLFQKGVGINNYQSDKISGELFWVKHVLEKYSISVVFDVGAHKGDYTQIFRSSGYEGEIYLFEPHPETYDLLVKRSTTIDSDRHFNVGFSNKSGSQLIYDYNKDGGSPHATLYSEVITDLHKSDVKSVEVNLWTLDEFASAHKIEKISLLKIDTEGNEFNILEGAQKLIENNNIEIIQFEFGEMNIVSRRYFKDFYDLLVGRYNLYRLLPNSLLPIVDYNSRRHEILIYQNIVAIHKSLDSK